MATGLDLIREENPALALIPDDELIEQILEQYQGDLDPDVYVESLLNEMPVESPVVAPTQGAVTGKRPYGMAGSDPDDIGYGEAFTSGLKSMWQRTWGPNITYLRGGIAGLMGNEEKASQLYQQAREQDQAILNNSPYISFEQATKGPDAGVDTFVKWGLMQAGMAVPFALTGGVGGLAGKVALKSAIGARAGTAVGRFTGFAPTMAAFNIARQEEQVQQGNLDEVNEGLAFATALPQAVLETALYPVLRGLFGPISRTGFSTVIDRATLGRVTKGSTMSAATEALTEVGQQALERYQAGLELDSEDAIREYKEAAAGGAFVGGLFGGVATTAGEAVRAVQPKTQIQEPKVQEGIQQKPEATVLPDEQKTQSVNLAKEEEAKPVTFTVEQQGEKFALNRQDETGNKVAVGTFNTQQEATTKQQEIENQKSKLSQQTFFTKDEIIKENPTIGNIINELEEQGNTIAPHVKQVYFQKNLALPKGDFTNVQASGGTTNSVVDGWYDRTSDLGYIGLSDLSKASETVAHENFHALQRQINRGYQTGLFKQDEQSALDTFLPGGTIDSIAPSVQKGLGKDVMNRLRERHADRTITNREMQAYAFGAYSSMKGQGKRIAAPNPVIRAFQRLFDLVKKAGNVFRKNKVNSVQDLFEKARTGEIGKRAVPKEGVEQLRPKALAAAEKEAAKGKAPVSTEYSITTPITDKAGKTFSTILPTISPIGEFVAKQSYQRGLGGARLQKIIEPYAKNAVSKSDVDGSVYSKALTDIQSNETELNQNKEYISIRDAEGNSTTLGDTSGRLVNKDYGQPELERLGNAYGTLLKVQAPTIDYSLSRVEFREQIRNNDDAFGKKYKLKTALSEGKKENLSKIGIALDKEHAETYGVINQTPRFVKGKIAEENQKEFNDAVEAGYQELKYQLELGGETAISGTGWYNKAITDTIERVKDILPQMREGSVAEQTDKELQFKLFLALFSPQGGPTQNLDVATQVFKEYLETGKAVTKKSLFVGSPKFGVSHQSMVSSLKLVDYLSKKHGKKPGDLKNYLFSTQTYKQLGKEKLDSGFLNLQKSKKQDLDYAELSDVNKTSFNSETGKIEDSILMPAYMFGEKVGTFFLNFNNIEGVTKDRWFSRHFYRQFGQVGIARDPKTGKPLKSETRMVSSIGGGKVERTYPPGHDPVTKLRDVPKANDRKVMELYVEGVKQKAIDDGLLKGEDATRQNVQAILWYFEQGLYTDLGLKSVPIDYVQAVEALENKIKNDIKTGGQSYGQFYNTKSVKGTATDVKTKTKTKEKELSVSERKETEKLKSDLELSVSPDTALRDTDIDAFQESGSDVSAYSAKEYNKAKITRGPLVGHCAACAYVLQKNYGGDIYSVIVTPREGYNTSREKHYFNKLPNGNFIDLTGEQYGNEGISPPQDFIDRAKISKYQWGRFDPSKSDKENKEIAGVKSVNSKFIKFEENVSKRLAATGFGMSPRAALGEPELSVSENLQDVIPTEFSVSGKKLNADNVNLVINKDISSEFTINKTFDEQVGTIQLLQRDAKEKLKPIEGEGDGTGRFLIGIEYDGEGVGYVMGGVTESNTAYIHMAQLFDEDNYASPSLWKKVAKELKNRFGVTKFSGLRITGTRNTDNFVGKTIFVSRDTEQFNVSEYNESDAVEYSVSDKLLSDKEIQDSQLPSNVKAKLFLNRDIKKGTPVSVRPNLNGRVIKGEDKLFVQTIHPGNDLNKALAYDGAVRLTNPELYVSQRARANIASKKQNKFPMAAGRGLYSTEKPSLEGQVLNFNPMTGHLFVDSSGYAVKSIKGDATFFNTKVYTTGELEYYTPENAPKPLDNIETNISYKPNQYIEIDTLSQEQLIKYGLEFSVSKDKFSEGTERVLSNINPTRQRRTIPGYWKSLTDNFRTRAHQGLVDQYSSVKKYIGEEPYKLLTMTHSSSGAIEGALNYGVPFLDKDGAIDLKDNTLGTGLFTRLEKLGETLPDFLAWVAANRAKYLTTVGKETGLGNIEDINTAIKELPKGKEKLFNEVNKDLNEFRNAFLQIARDSGYLSQEAYNAWTGQAGYNFYIPFYRLLEDETSRSGPQAADSIIDQPEVKKYVGSTLPVKDLFSNMLQNFNFLAEASLRNQAGLKTLEQGVAMGVTRKVDGPTKDSVFARKNGKQVHYEIDEPLVLQSLEALNWSGWSNPAMGILRNFKRYLTIGVTASPAFRIRNLIRDTIHSIAVSKISYNPLNNVLQGGKGFSLKGRKLSEARAKMAFGGGEIHFGHIYGGDPNATQMLLDRNIDLNTVMRYDGWTEGSKRFFKSKVGKGLDWWQEVGNTAENVNRSALYQQLRDKGVGHFEASYQARDLLNFSRHGANPAIRFLTQSIPFLNARIQGLDKAGRAFNQGQRAQLLTTLGAYSLASVGLYLAFKDDDDFKDREQWDRDTYHWFKIPGSETAFRIPRPFEVGSVGVMFERMVEQMVDDDVHGSLFAERMLHTITETFAIDYKPQLITPALEVYANKDTFTKRPIESNWMEKLPPSERKYAYTSSAYVNTSKALELIPWKAIQYSPVQIEHLVQGYFGWVGSSVAQVISFSDYPRKFTQFTSAESPLFMGFVKPLPSIRTKYKTEFYEAMREMNEVNALMNMYMKTGETDKAMKVYNKNKDLIAWRSTYVKTNTQITKINRQIKLIESQKNLSEREKYLKVKQLNLLKSQIMRTLKENVLAYEKANDTRVKRPLWWK